MIKNYKLKNEKYLKVQDTDGGYDYTLYNKNKELIDGGLLEEPNLSDEEALKVVLEFFDIPTDIECEELDEDIDDDSDE